MTHNIEADGTMSSRTVSSSDYHAKCAGCVEKDREIASLTARIETSVGVDVWKMTVQEFERTIATLTAERDAVGGLVAAIEEYLIAPATTGPQQLREALGVYTTTRNTVRC